MRTTLTCALVGALAAVPATPASASGCAQRAERLYGKLPDKQRVGQMIMMVGTSDASGSPDGGTVTALRETKAGSVISFERPGPKAAARYNNRLQSQAKKIGRGLPLLVGTDAEFGVAHRVGGSTPLSLAMSLGASRSPLGARRAAEITGLEARTMGYHWAFAPVADVNTNPSNPVIGVRSFSGRAALAARLTVAQVAGYRDAGVIGTPKHFPGHGDTSVDSHTGLPVVSYPWKKLWKVHLKPFRQAVAAGVESLMTAHVVVRAVDPERPATLSRKVLTGLLRKRIGFKGLIVTDAMTMAGVRSRWGIETATRMAARAGADVIMSTGSPAEHRAVASALRSALRDRALTRRSLKASVKRVLRAKCRRGLLDGRFVSADRAARVAGRKEHRRDANAIARSGVTLVKNKGGKLPFNPKRSRRTLVASVMHTGRLAGMIRASSRGGVVEWSSSTSPSDGDINRAVSLARSVDRIIVGTYSRGALPAGQARLVKRLVRTGKPVVAISLGLPYDLDRYPQVPAYIASYAQGPWPHVSPTALRAAVKVVFGAQPGGKLPVPIGSRFRFGRGLTY